LRSLHACGSTGESGYPSLPVATGLVLLDFIPDDIFALPPHFFGNEGALTVGLMMLVAGFFLRRSGR